MPCEPSDHGGTRVTPHDAPPAKRPSPDRRGRGRTTRRPRLPAARHGSARRCLAVGVALAVDSTRRPPPGPCRRPPGLLAPEHGQPTTETNSEIRQFGRGYQLDRSRAVMASSIASENCSPLQADNGSAHRFACELLAGAGSHPGSTTDESVVSAGSFERISSWRPTNRVVIAIVKAMRLVHSLTLSPAIVWAKSIRSRSTANRPVA